MSEVPGVLRRLSVEDYSDGPLDDDTGRSLKWWIFSPEFSGVTLYVKLSVLPGKLLCMSFHPAEHPLPHPFFAKEVSRT